LEPGRVEATYQSHIAKASIWLLKGRFYGRKLEAAHHARHIGCRMWRRWGAAPAPHPNPQGRHMQNVQLLRTLV